MRIFAQKPKAQQIKPAEAAKACPTLSRQHSDMHSILQPQRTIGNQAVQRLPRTDSGSLEVEPSIIAATRFAHDFSRIPIYATTPVRIQPRLMVNRPRDIYEQEADRVAEQVMRIPEPQVQRACACGEECPKCQTKHPDQEQSSIQTKQTEHAGENASQHTTVPPLVHKVLHSPSQSLDKSVRSYFEPLFGHDFNHVRVHSGRQAEQAARSINARAFTAGNHIVFGGTQYSFNSREGQRLLAHELTHVIQQSGASGIHAIGSQGHDSLLQRTPEDPGDVVAVERTPEQREALIEDVLGAIAANEVGGRAQAVESGLGTSSGRAASYASATQMIPAHALGVLRHEPEYAAEHGLDSHGIERATAIDRAVRRVWTAIVENQIDVPIVETRYASEIADAHLTQDDLTAMQRFEALRAEIGRHVRQVPLEGGREGQTRRAVVTESGILAELTTRREAALTQLAGMIASESPTGILETPATPPVGAESAETAASETSQARAAIDAFPIERRPWPQVVPGPPVIPRRLLDQPARGRQAFRSRRAQRVQWIHGLSRQLAAINLVAEARRISQRALAAELSPMYEGLGDLRERDVAAYARGNVRGTAAIWREDLNGWIRLALSRERTQPDGPTLDDVIASAASHEGGYALSRLEYRRAISEYLDDHPTATDRDVVLVAARRNAGAADYFSRIWPHFQRLQRERTAREAAATQ